MHTAREACDEVRPGTCRCTAGGASSKLMHSSRGVSRGEGGGCLCWDLMLEQLQRPELATAAGRDTGKRGSVEGLRWLVSADVNTCGVKSAGSTQWLQLYLLLASGKWQNRLDFSTEQFSVKRSHSYSVAAASGSCFSSLFLAGFIHFSLAALG